MIKITSRKDGFRRCGIAHGKESAVYADDRFSEDELEILRAEPNLVVEVYEGVGLVDENLSAKEAIKLAKEAGDLESLDVLAEGEERKSVLAAIEARRKELVQE